MPWRSGRGCRLRSSATSGDELFEFTESLAAESARGYHDAQGQLSDAAHQWRGRVLDLVLAGPAVASGELALHATAGNWPVPARVAMIAIRPTPGVALPSARVLHPATLAKLHAEHPMVLHPAPLSLAAGAELATLFEGHRIAIGIDVPLADAGASLRWARRALELAERGLIADEQVIDCAAHLGSLWIHAEPLLADIVATTTLAPLFAEPRTAGTSWVRPCWPGSRPPAAARRCSPRRWDGIHRPLPITTRDPTVEDTDR